MSTVLDAVNRGLRFVYDRPFLCWGVAPSVGAAVGFLSTCAALELLLRQPWVDRYMIRYPSIDGPAPDSRREKIKHSQEKNSWWAQLRGSLFQTCGPLNIVGAVVNWKLFPLVGAVIPAPGTPLLPSPLTVAWEVLKLMTVDDFFLYWGHRMQHDIEFLWKNFHSLHHQLATPTPVGTAFIDTNDAALQAGLPIVLAGLIVRPHPVSYWCFTAFRLSNNALNHSGLEFWLVNAITLKWLPFRCRNSHHDAHHRFASYGRNAKNYAEVFVVWDWLFGTLSHSKMAAVG